MFWIITRKSCASLVGSTYLLCQEKVARKKHRIFPALFQQDRERTAVEVAFFSGQFQYIKLIFEFRLKSRTGLRQLIHRPYPAVRIFPNMTGNLSENSTFPMWNGYLPGLWDKQSVWPTASGSQTLYLRNNMPRLESRSGHIISTGKSTQAIYCDAFFLLRISRTGESSWPLGMIGVSSGVIADTDKKSFSNISLASQMMILSRFILIANSV